MEMRTPHPGDDLKKARAFVKQAEIDLSALAADSATGGALDRWRTLDLGFQIDSIADSRHWQLQPGEVNILDTRFWIPSPIGIGAAVIVLLCAVGYGVRYGVLGRS